MDERDLDKAELFDSWNEKQKQLDANKRRLLFKEGEIWWCSIGMNIGEEVYGKGSSFRRPVVILKKLSENSCVVLPLTTKEHVGNWYYSFVTNRQIRWVMLNQIRSISANRLIKRESSLTEPDFEQLKKSEAKLLGLL